MEIEFNLDKRRNRMSMFVKNCDFHSYENGNMRAFVKVTLGDSEGNEITIDGFRVMNGSNGLFVSAPSEKGKDGEWRDKVWVPKDNPFRNIFQDEVIALYKDFQAGDRVVTPPAQGTPPGRSGGPSVPGRGARRVGPPPNVPIQP